MQWGELRAKKGGEGGDEQPLLWFLIILFVIIRKKFRSIMTSDADGTHARSKHGGVSQQQNKPIGRDPEKRRLSVGNRFCVCPRQKMQGVLASGGWLRG